LREALSAFRPLRSSRGGRLGRRRGPEGLHDHILDIVERAAAHPFPDERFEFRAVNFNGHDRRILIQLCCHAPLESQCRCRESLLETQPLVSKRGLL